VLPVVQSQNGGFWQAQFAVAVYVVRALTQQKACTLPLSDSLPKVK
jgi:hypothetical protein